MKSPFPLLLILLVALFATAADIHAARVKDIAQIHGVRSNQLIGYGLVTGLDRTGDDMRRSVFTVQAIYNMMTRNGITINPDTIRDIRVKNVAAVMVTATLPPFAVSGSTIDVQVSSMGDARSLGGGTLLMTPLKGPDGEVYAVAQGPLTIGAFYFGGRTARVQKNHPTVGQIPGGAIVERSVPVEIGADGCLLYQLSDADFTTAANIAEAVNKKFGPSTAFPNSPGTVKITIPQPYRNSLIDFVSAVETLQVDADTVARIVVNERTGTIVMGQDVRLSTVAVSHGNLSLVISEDLQVSQPQPFGQGRTVVTPQTTAEVIEEPGELVVLHEGVSIGEIANALNAIGATPRDLIAIFQAIKASGSLQGELLIM
ncbi:MAG: flagellar basal body P-ring protein FlgI [Desulforhopalus sp.]